MKKNIKRNKGIGSKEKEAPVSQTLPEKLERLEQAAKPLYELLRAEYDPMCHIVIDWQGVQVVRAEYGMPLR